MPQPSTCVSVCSPGPNSVPCFGGLSNPQGRRQASCRAGHEGLLPAFVAITEGKTDDLSTARALRLPKGSIVVMDRGYNDYAWYNQLHNNDIYFVTQLKTNAHYRVIERRTVLKNKGLTCDQTIQLTSTKAKNYPIRLRRIGYKDAHTGIQYTFLTNNFKLAARTIADVYKAR